MKLLKFRQILLTILLFVMMQFIWRFLVILLNLLLKILAIYQIISIKYYYTKDKLIMISLLQDSLITLIHLHGKECINFESKKKKYGIILLRFIRINRKIGDHINAMKICAMFQFQMLGILFCMINLKLHKLWVSCIFLDSCDESKIQLFNILNQNKITIFFFYVIKILLEIN